jgi:hypothetical protein
MAARKRVCKEYDLKKQSQFGERKMDTRRAITGTYRDFGGWGQRKNKANLNRRDGLRRL